MSAGARVPVSPTKVDVWQQCGHRFRLQYVEKIPVDGSWAHLSMGNAVHAALRDWFDIDDVRRSPDAAAALVTEKWDSSGFRDDEQSAHWRRTAAQWVRSYCEKHPAPVPHSRERTLGEVAQHVTISGRIDRIDERGDELVIVDYKTGRRVPTDDDARVSRALAIYAVVTQRSLKRPTYLVQLHHVPSGVIAEHRHTDESLSRQLSRVDAIGRDIQRALAGDAELPPAPGPLCGWCDYQQLCPAGRALPPKPRWAGLAEDTDSLPI